MRSTLCRILLLWGLFPGHLLGQSLLPPGMPEVYLVRYDNTELCDYLFTEAIQWATPGDTSFALLFDRNGDIAWYETTTGTFTNFTLLGNGQVGYFTQSEYLLLDSSMQLVGGLGCASSRRNDSHELIIAPDGRTFLICLERSDGVDLSGLLTRDGDPGSSSGVLWTGVIQELDGAGNLVKEWRAKPYYTVYDVDAHFFTDPNALFLNHPNALDWDGRYLLVSHRNNNEVLLLDWATDEIVWRLGGTYNQFAFTNDQGLHGQHDARFLGNDRISVFDNGVQHNPAETRGLIYHVDTVNMTVTRENEYPAPDSLSAMSMGGFRVLPGGDVLRSHGHNTQINGPRIVREHSDGSPAWEIYYDSSHWTYRAQCHTPTWRLPRPAIQCLPQGNALQLSVDASYGDFLWSDGATTATITVTDTGRYQVFVPYGRGRMGSEVLHVTSLNGQCPAVSRPEPQVGSPRPATRVRTVDLLGREVVQRRRGRVYVEIYSDGTARKVMVH
ncbi:MAG: arylsulfotransferase family protein [Bacteroidota bacterium]